MKPSRPTLGIAPDGHSNDGAPRDDPACRHLRRPLAPHPISEGTTILELVDGTMTAFNARQLAAACQLYAEQLAADNVRIGMSLSGALVPAGLGRSCLVPMIRRGMIDWMVSTGANLYHDLQMALGYQMYFGTPHANDTQLRNDGVVRIYDLFFESEALYTTDQFIRDTFRRLVTKREITDRISSADIHFWLGQELLQRSLALREFSVLAAAADVGLPIHTASPGDSGIGMNLAALQVEGIHVQVEPSIDVNETAAYVYDIKHAGGRSAVLILGGGSSKNFVLQTEPYLQEVLGLEENGHDFFIQLTDARPDTGGLSGATPSEAVSWGKVDPDKLSQAVVCYGDCSVYLPLLVRYAVEKSPSRPHSRLYHSRRELSGFLFSQVRVPLPSKA